MKKMKPVDRRRFIFTVVGGATALLAAPVLLAEGKGPLPPDDPYAKSMGFVVDTNLADGKRYKKHSPDQSCANCQLYKGEPGSAEGPCSFFGHRIVPSTGWCRNYKPQLS
jgi:hypothetical protein